MYSQEVTPNAESGSFSVTRFTNQLVTVTIGLLRVGCDQSEVVAVEEEEF